MSDDDSWARLSRIIGWLASDCHKTGRGGGIGSQSAAVTADIVQRRPRTNKAEPSVPGGRAGSAPADPEAHVYPSSILAFVLKDLQC